MDADQGGSLDADHSNTTCNICQKQFSKPSYCKKHIKNVHNKSSDSNEAKPVFTCVLCHKQYTKKWSLKKHKEIVHSDNFETFKCSDCTFVTPHKRNLIRHIVKQHKNKPANHKLSKKLQCSRCKSKFLSVKTLKYHEKHIHNCGQLCVIKRKCPLCNLTVVGQSKKTINNHIENTHNIVLASQCEKFNDIEEFHTWKLEIEKNTNSFYSKTHGSKSTQSYQCHRCGIFKSKGKNLRHMRIKGSVKINGFCPSVMKVKKLTDGSFAVTYVSTHVGHKNELKHVHLSKAKQGIRNNMRKHIHLVIRQERAQNETDHDSNPELHHSEEEQEYLEVLSLEKQILAEVGGKESSSSFENERRRLIEEFDGIVKKLKTTEDVQMIRNLLKPAVPTLQAMD